jgi:hypothetical protein
MNDDTEDVVNAAKQEVFETLLFDEDYLKLLFITVPKNLKPQIIRLKIDSTRIQAERALTAANKGGFDNNLIENNTRLRTIYNNSQEKQNVKGGSLRTTWVRMQPR